MRLDRRPAARRPRRRIAVNAHKRVRQACRPVDNFGSGPGPVPPYGAAGSPQYSASVRCRLPSAATSRIVRGRHLLFSRRFSPSGERAASDTSRPPYSTCERRSADPVLATHVCRRRNRLLLSQIPIISSSPSRAVFNGRLASTTNFARF